MSPPTIHIRSLALGIALLGLVMTGCDGGSGVSGDRGTAAPGTPTTAPPSTPVSALDTSDACSFIASTIIAELTRWTGSDDIVNAPIAETRLGPQPDGGVPGNMVDGCVWEARGATGGHIGVAVERFASVDMDGLIAMAADESMEGDRLNDGRWRWNVPPSGESPSGAVVVGDDTYLVVVRLESYSDNAARTYLDEARSRSATFFEVVGDAVEASGSA